MPATLTIRDVTTAGQKLQEWEWANDRNWADGGPGGHYGGYWVIYSFGELSATAQTCKQALERLIPRLKIANNFYRWIGVLRIVSESGSSHIYLF